MLKSKLLQRNLLQRLGVARSQENLKNVCTRKHLKYVADNFCRQRTCQFGQGQSKCLMALFLNLMKDCEQLNILLKIVYFVLFEVSVNLKRSINSVDFNL